jgi:hypothetical protein
VKTNKRPWNSSRGVVIEVEGARYDISATYISDRDKRIIETLATTIVEAHNFSVGIREAAQYPHWTLNPRVVASVICIR